MRKNSCVRFAVEITLYFISRWWERSHERGWKGGKKKRAGEKIKSVKFTLPIKRKINAASRSRLPEAIIFEIQDPPAYFVRRPEKITYLFMISPCAVKEGKDRAVCVRIRLMLPRIVKVKESDRWWIHFLRRKVIYEPYDSPYRSVPTGNDVGVWDSSRAQIRVMTREYPFSKQWSWERRQRRTWWRSLCIGIRTTLHVNNDRKISDRLYIDW